MVIRLHPPMSILYNTRQTTLGELESLSGTAVKQLYQYVADLDLLVCGPPYWFYYGMDGNPDNPFTLEIALPIHGKVPSTLLPHFKKIPAFRSLVFRHEGSWKRLPETYGKMMSYIEANELKMNGICSESFLHIDLEKPDNNATEIRIGLLEESAFLPTLREI